MTSSICYEHQNDENETKTANESSERYQFNEFWSNMDSQTAESPQHSESFYFHLKDTNNKWKCAWSMKMKNMRSLRECTRTHKKCIKCINNDFWGGFGQFELLLFNSDVRENERKNCTRRLSQNHWNRNDWCFAVSFTVSDLIWYKKTKLSINFNLINMCAFPLVPFIRI